MPRLLSGTQSGFGLSSFSRTAANGPAASGVPTVQSHLLSGQGGGPRTWAVIFHDGDEIMSGLADWVMEEQLAGGHFTAIGAFSSALFGWFDDDGKSCRGIRVDENVKCVGLIGDIGRVEGRPALHVHGWVQGPDGAVRSGNLLVAVASPTLEVFVTEAIPLQGGKDPAVTPERSRFN